MIIFKERPQIGIQFSPIAYNQLNIKYMIFIYFHELEWTIRYKFNSKCNYCTYKVTKKCEYAEIGKEEYLAKSTHPLV